MVSKFKDKAVLFIDILGFRELIRSPAIKDKLLDILTGFHTQHERFASGYIKIISDAEFEFCSFSDCIVASCEVKDNSIKVLGNYASGLQYQLMLEGILSRGGIAFGDLFHKKNVIIGQAMIDAYEMEAELAFYPRVVIGKQIRDAFDVHLKTLDQKKKSEQEHLFIFSEDNINFVNPFYNGYFAKDDQKSTYATQAIEPILNSLRNKFPTNAPPKIQAKYSWMIKLGEKLAQEPYYNSRKPYG